MILSLCFCYFPFERILSTRADYLPLNPTCMCSIVHAASSFEELCAVYLPCLDGLTGYEPCARNARFRPSNLRVKANT
jgi:hypothetical protein